MTRMQAKTERSETEHVQTNELIVALASVKLTVVLLSLLTIISIAATFLPHLNLYYSPVYITILVLTGLNLSVCSLRRMHRLKWRITQRSAGYLATHLGLLTILIGATITLVGGERYNIWLSKGMTISEIQIHSDESQSFQSIPLGMELTLNDFELKLHDSGMPDAFTSFVSIAEDGQPERETQISVNDPLTINGFTYYQSNYRVDPDLKVSLRFMMDPWDTAVVREFQIDGEPSQLQLDDQVTLDVAVLRYEPDFVMAGPDRIGSRSALPRNPAILVGTQKQGHSPETQWLFLRHKNIHDSDSGKNMMITFESVEHSFETGLEVVRDPGTVWVATGAILLVLGLFVYLLSPTSTRRTN